MPNPINAPLSIQLRKEGESCTQFSFSIQTIKNTVPTEMPANSAQCHQDRPCFPEVLYNEGKVPAMKPMNNQVNNAG